MLNQAGLMGFSAASSLLNVGAVSGRSRSRSGTSVAAAIALVIFFSPAQPSAQRSGVLNVPAVFEPAGVYTGRSLVAAPRDRRRAASADAVGTSPFVVSYTGFTPAAQTAFQFAVDIWGSEIASPVPIRINAQWRSDLPAGILGSAGPAVVLRDTPNAPIPGTYYPVALANARAGIDLYEGEEIAATFNANVDWYLGVDGDAGTRYDFVTVALHEIGHGLGLFGSMRYENGVGTWGVGTPAAPLAYDAYLTASGHALTDASAYPNGSTQLGVQLVSDAVSFGGTSGRTGNAGTEPLLFAPNPWVSGSSIMHLSSAAFPPGSPNSLMTPSIAPGRSIHAPGSVALGMLGDLGWTLLEAIQTSSAPRPPVNVRLLY